jgi:hypothetical protein
MLMQNSEGSRSGDNASRAHETKKKSYVSPILSEYGTVAKLTQALNVSGVSDTARKKACL